MLLDERAWLHAQFKVELDLSSSDRLRLQHLLEVDIAKQVLKGTTEVKESHGEVIVTAGNKQTIPQGLEIDQVRLSYPMLKFFSKYRFGRDPTFHDCLSQFNPYRMHLKYGHSSFLHMKH